MWQGGRITFARIDTKILYLATLILSLLRCTVVIFPEFRDNDFPLLPEKPSRAARGRVFSAFMPGVAVHCLFAPAMLRSRCII